MSRILPEEVEVLSAAHKDILERYQRGLFVRLPDENRILVGLLHEDVEKLKESVPCHIRPDRLPKDAIALEMLTVLPLYQDKLSIGWIVKLPRLPHKIGDHFISIKRKGAVVEAVDKATVSLLLKSITGIMVPDVSTMLLSHQAKDVRT